jgi:hypothetical protein
MHLFITLATILIAGTLVLFVPGATLLAALRLNRVVPPALMPGASLAGSLALMAVATTIALLLHLPIWMITAMLALVTLGAIGALVRRHGKGIGEAFGSWGGFATPGGAVLVAIGLGAIAVSVGYFAWNDSAYHVAQAQKLLHLSHPTFSNTLQFRHGTAHPGYLLPLWQEALAQVAFVSRQDPMEVAWVLPGLTVATSALAFGGLLWALTRARAAATVGTLSWGLVAALGPLPLSDAVYNAMHPGGIALTVLMPLILSMLFVGAWPEHLDATAPRSIGMTTRDVTRCAAIIAGGATACFGILHVSNLVLMAIGMAAYLGIWALRAPWSKAVVWRHFTMFGTVALVAVICVGSLYPGLSKLQSFGKDAATELKQNESDLYVGKNAAPLPALLKGDVKGESYHLRADYLVLGGGLSIIALFALVLAFLAPRWPGAWYFGGTGFVVLFIALTNSVYPHFVDVVSLDQARRIEKSLPLAIGLGAGALLVASAAQFAWSKGRGFGQAVGVIIMGAAGWGLWHLTDTIKVMQGYDGKQIVEPRVITTALALLGVMGLLLVVLLVVRLVRGEGARDKVEAMLRLPRWQWPPITASVGALAVALLLIGAWPVHARVQDMWVKDRLEVPRGTGPNKTTEDLPTYQRLGELRVFSIQVVNRLRKLPVGSTVLLDPRARDPYLAMAVAPVYVVSSVPRHTANTPGNHVAERYDTAVSFYDTKNDLTDQERLELLLDQKVDAVTIHPRSALRFLVEHIPGFKRVAYGKNQFLYTVDRAKLAAYLERNTPTDYVQDALDAAR